MLDEHNPLVKTFRHARDLLEEHNGIDVSIRIIGANKEDQVQYEMPHTEELAILVVGELKKTRPGVKTVPVALQIRKSTFSPGRENPQTSVPTLTRWLSVA